MAANPRTTRRRHRPGGVVWLALAGAAGTPSVADLAAHCGRVGLAPFPARAVPQPGCRRSRPTSLPATGPLGITARGGSSACSGWVTGWPGPHTAVEQVPILACLAGC